MDSTVVLPVISALAALLGVALTAFVQHRNQRSNQEFQMRSEAVKREREQVYEDRAAALQHLSVAHKLLNKIAREFSITSLDILWRSKLSDVNYDARYLSACLEMDELRAFASLNEPFLSEDIEEMSSQMNIFWGNFKLVLHQTALGQEVNHMIPCFTCAHEAADKIGRISRSLKARIAQRVVEVRNAA